jgi:cell wall-associated NlpC family hydrolase
VSGERLPGERLANAALELVGTRFRLHGRDPARGLDCVGLVHASLVAIGRISFAPEGYRLRNSDPAIWFELARKSGFGPATAHLAQGDLVLIEPGPGQQHLVIAANSRAGIHAHAGLGRVVLQPMVFPATPLARWRLT